MGELVTEAETAASAEATKAFLDALPGETLEADSSPTNSDQRSVEEEKSPNSNQEIRSSEDVVPQESEETTEEAENTDGEESSEETPKEPDSKPPPFHKHPRFRRLIEENKSLKAVVEENNKLLAEMKSSKKGSSSDIPEWFSAYVGDSPDAWDKFKSYSDEQQKTYTDQIQQVVRDTIAKEREGQTQHTESMQLWLDEQLQDLRDEGLSFKDQDIIDVMREFKPTNDAGDLDFRKGHDLLKRLKLTQQSAQTEKDEARKSVAAKTTSGSSGSSQKSGVDMKMIKNLSMHDLANMD